jgi:hypothetical protein
VREETQKPLVICIHCKLPITQEQRPSVQLTDGRELHAECYNTYYERLRRKMD